MVTVLTMVVVRTLVVVTYVVLRTPARAAPFTTVVLVVTGAPVIGAGAGPQMLPAGPSTDQVPVTVDAGSQLDPAMRQRKKAGGCRRVADTGTDRRH